MGKLKDTLKRIIKDGDYSMILNKSSDGLHVGGKSFYDLFLVNDGLIDNYVLKVAHQYDCFNVPLRNIKQINFDYYSMTIICNNNTRTLIKYDDVLIMQLIYKGEV